ncbi:putative DNA damage repair protein Mus42 [Aspergillus affinis]|uniref:putative DNA damage repair protein Mus42 n=1 Tax=Aspergillus affinis TaxID=1070780 RepID=UPI0022FEBF2F|nr:putative DNA damage repair protein Mus42 [Aspergillus affinis]KAI9046154.1 putative DNA damage repair protein Mus42 [Aspergillus affinis]
MGSALEANSSAVRKRIESHQFEDEEGEEYGASAFGGLSDYMRRKKIKLQNLDAEIRSTAADCPPIFRRVVAHVNGYTQPSLQDLHRLIVSHGGGFLQYLDGKTAATHIIASSLTPKKREEFRRYRIVKPAWVVESVKAGRMLPWDAFRVVDEGQSQKVLKFGDGHFTSQTHSPQSGYKDQSSSSWYTEQLKASASANTSELKQPSPGSPTPAHGPNQSFKESQSDYGDFPSFASLDEPNETTTPRQAHDDANRVDGFEIDETTQISPATRSPLPPPSIGQSAISPSRAVPKPNMSPEEYNAELLSDPRMKSSSVVNPEFLQQYYKESRLHHLSTWKAELKAQLQSAAKEKSQAQTGRRRHTPGARKYVMHVDFDCFFAAVSTLKHPELEGKPVAVAHGSGSGSEIASCNYVARAHGVKNGMWMKGALQACPDLKVVPYDFPAYEEASRKFYSAILAIEGIVQSVSIDEALVDITSQCLEAGGTDGKGVFEGSIYREQAKGDEIGQALRVSVKDQTGCAISVGIGGNILQAKVALRKAKPAGQFQLKPDAVLEFIGNLPVQNLPGVGYSLGAKLEEIGVKFVKDINDLSREKLTSSLGPKTGIRMWEYARGVDRTEVGNEVMRKSVSAEVNWGIRFVNQTQAEDFVTSLCGELHRRLVENLVKGKQLTLKVMRRSADAPLEPVKHLGHGKCDVFNKSIVLGISTNESGVLAKEANSMLRGFGISPGDLRGLGVQMTKLEPLASGTTGRLESSQKQLTFKASPVRKPMEQSVDPDNLDSPRKGESESVSHGPSLNDSAHKPLNILGSQFIMPSQPDPKILAELPSDIRSKLVAQGKRRRDSRSVSPSPMSRRAPQPQPAATELPPQSQLDPETLAALPEDVRAEVLGYYNPPLGNDVESVPTPVEPSRPSSSGLLKYKKPTTPTKKRRGRPSLKPSDNLLQSKFLFPKASAPTRTDTSSLPWQPSPSEGADEVSADFLAALPDDIRREVLEEHRQARMLQRSSTSSTAAPRAIAPTRNPSAPVPQAQEPRLQLPPLPERPTFTSLKLSSLSDLRDTVGSWHAAFSEDGPFDEDVTSLCVYLKRVVVDEKDIDKAVSVISWLMWLVEDGKAKTPRPSNEPPSTSPGMNGSSQPVVTWDDAVRSLQQSIQDGLEERDLPPVEFS